MAVITTVFHLFFFSKPALFSSFFFVTVFSFFSNLQNLRKLRSSLLISFRVFSLYFITFFYFLFQVYSSMEMTPKSLRQLCLQQNLYGTPHINDKLYLHYKVYIFLPHFLSPFYHDFHLF